jgi:DNA-directed RNA polymerase II subunit RPB1
LKKVLDCCKSKTKCDAGDEIDENDTRYGEEDTEKKKSHGGCGAQQPKITIDGMKLVAEFKPSRKKADEQDQYMPEPVERKQQLSAEKVLCHFEMPNCC